MTNRVPCIKPSAAVHPSRLDDSALPRPPFWGALSSDLQPRHVMVLVPPRGDAAAVRAAMMTEAMTFDGLDKTVVPQVYWVRIDERGTLLRLVATCSDSAAADKLVQRTLARAVQIVFRNSL